MLTGLGGRLVRQCSCVGRRVTAHPAPRLISERVRSRGQRILKPNRVGRALRAGLPVKASQRTKHNNRGSNLSRGAPQHIWPHRTGLCVRDREGLELFPQWRVACQGTDRAPFLSTSPKSTRGRDLSRRGVRNPNPEARTAANVDGPDTKCVLLPSALSPFASDIGIPLKCQILALCDDSTAHRLGLRTTFRTSLDWGARNLAENGNPEIRE